MCATKATTVARKVPGEIDSESQPRVDDWVTLVRGIRMSLRLIRSEQDARARWDEADRALLACDKLTRLLEE